MVELITEKVIEILTSKLPSDSSFWIYNGGNAWPAGWPGVINRSLGDKAEAGEVSVFDTAFDIGGNIERPAVFLGSRSLDYQDELEFEAINSLYVEYRKLTLPLIIVCADDSRADAMKQRNQLKKNIRRLFADYMTTNLWYQLSFPGGNQYPDRGYTSSTGGDSSVNNAEAIGVLSVCIHYMFNPFDLNAA